ncbi:MAG TPA: hypothetical protein VLA61_28890 [Ideonella sp.]|uniref:hypothetical protein n=1 Tax=Ideonella sp. TaxID=1929293 RepID=UPI002BC82E70|nr:hypothetical protein [Ideonella sp.]HSI52303.1 hypothetical protein [Ideonella sp.]
MTTPPDEPLPEEPTDNIFGPLNKLSRALQSHDERGLVLSLAAFAEEALGDLILAFLRDNKSSRDLFAGFNAPLGTLSARIKAAHALGLIDEEQFNDFECLRKIRNEFAHSWDCISLERQDLAAYARNMSFSRLDHHYPSTSADKVRSSISALLADIRSGTNQIRLKDGGLKVQPHQLFPIIYGDGGGSSNEKYFEQAKARFAELEAALSTATGEEKRFFLHHLKLFTTQVGLLCTHVPFGLRPETRDFYMKVKAEAAKHEWKKR